LGKIIPRIALFGFHGLKPGDRWCLCAPRWREALEAGKASRVVLRATQEGALEYCALADLKRFRCRSVVNVPTVGVSNPPKLYQR